MKYIKLMPSLLVIIFFACNKPNNKQVKNSTLWEPLKFDSTAIERLEKILRNNDYASSEENAYFDSTSTYFGDFKPESPSEIQRVPVNYVKVIRVPESAKYNLNQFFSLYYDSIIGINKKRIEKNYSLMDSIDRKIANEKLGIVSKMDIIKEARHGKKWAVIFTDNKYDDATLYGRGYWIALSFDKGKHWKKYYTGLSEKCHYFLKHHSNIPLWKDDSTLQIESVIVRKVSQAVHPISGPQFDVVKDGIALQINLNKIIKDSDRDGLTDIEENKMMLNPLNPDTDRDKIIDSKDLNPRFKSMISSKSTVYIALFDNVRPSKYGVIDIDNSAPETYRFPEYEEYGRNLDETYLLVTDDPIIQHLPFYSNRMIILSPKEYTYYKEKYLSTFNEFHCTKMFKCDKWKNAYIIHTGLHTSSSEHLILKTKKGWRIIGLSFSIS